MHIYNIDIVKMENIHILIVVVIVLAILYYSGNDKKEGMSVVTPDGENISVAPTLVPLGAFRLPKVGKNYSNGVDLNATALGRVGLSSAILQRQPAESVGNFVSRCASTCVAIGRPDLTASPPVPGCTGFVTTNITGRPQSSANLKGVTSPTSEAFENDQSKVSYIIQ